ncbi:MAG: ATP-binding protein [Acidobacteriota bacterium]
MAARRSTLRKPAKRKASATARLEHELEVHQVELELQNEELRTARTATETALARYTEVFDFAPIGYVALDAKGAIQEINHAACELLGHERGLLSRKRFGAFVVAPCMRAFEALLLAARTTGTARADVELAHGEQKVPVRISATALRREPLTFLLACEDISGQRAKEAELARTALALEMANRRKDEFLAMLSHELRNPLSPIRTSIEIMRLAPPDSPAAHDALAIVDRSTTHLTRLVDDLLDVTRITRGAIELQREPVELGALVRQSVADHAARFAQLGIALSTRIDREPLWVDGDPARLVQILSNLLGNAEKFTLPGGRVLVIAERAREGIIVRVRDTGIGIVRELIDQVFEPFVQAPQPLDRGRGGLGLGLAMVRSLVTLHGGHAAIRSAGLGRGTEASFVLPEIPATKRVAAPAAATATSCRVLIIEDKPDTVEALARGLQLRGHVVETATDGIAGIAAATRFHPDVILCDVGLPHLDGYGVARRLRASGAYLVALTGYARSEDVERAVAAGFSCHLAKPAGLDQIERIIARAPRRAPST